MKKVGSRLVVSIMVVVIAALLGRLIGMSTAQFDQFKDLLIAAIFATVASDMIETMKGG